jgi:uncharacterized protein YceH (UPF0502 family)
MSPFRASNVLLTDTEARVLGSMVEKDITTPDYYPMSLNALVNACNQKSNRDPVMNLNDGAVRQALHSLNEKGLAGNASSAGDSRVSKFEHRMQEAFNFTRPETAVMCVLMLRGPQTPGELRGRTERLHRFEDLTDVQSTPGQTPAAPTRHERVALRAPAMRREARMGDAAGSGRNPRQQLHG